ASNSKVAGEHVDAARVPTSLEGTSAGAPATSSGTREVSFKEDWQPLTEEQHANIAAQEPYGRGRVISKLLPEAAPSHSLRSRGHVGNLGRMGDPQAALKGPIR